MKSEIFHPKFPPLFEKPLPVWGEGNNLVSLQLLCSIPLFTLEKDSIERKRMEEEYWEQKNKEYNEMKDIYDKYIFVGTIFKGNTDASAKITKIFIGDKKAYICYKASEEHIKAVNKLNAELKTNYKPIKPGKFGLPSFISAITTNAIKIISVPEK